MNLKLAFPNQVSHDTILNVLETEVEELHHWATPRDTNQGTIMFIHLFQQTKS